MKYKILALLLTLPITLTTQAENGRFGLGVGIFALAVEPDVHLFYQPEQSHWMYGYRYLRLTSESKDPWFGNLLSEQTDTLEGPTLFYLFNNEDDASYYLGASVLKMSTKLTSISTGETDTDSTVAPFLGGGYIRWVNKQFYYHIGLFRAFGAELYTETSTSSHKQEDGGDLYLQIGILF